MNNTKQKKLIPSEELYNQVRAGFVSQGISLNRWCTKNKIARQNAATALRGWWRGPKADALVRRITKAANLKETIKT